MIEGKPRKKNGKKIFYFSIISFFIVLFFLLGFFAGIWQVIENQNNIPLLAAIQNITGSIDKSEEVDTGLYWKVWNRINDKYYERNIDEKDMFYGSLKGLVGSLTDPYSIFLDPDETKEFNQELSGSFEGIGAEIGIKNDQLQVIAPLPDSPAMKSNLKTGDVILKIDDQDTTEMSLDQAVALIRGPKGTSVELTVLKKDVQEIKQVSVTRDLIVVESVTWSMKDGSIAYIEISHFNSDTYNIFNSISNEVLLKNPNGIVLDLRNNPGGYLQDAINVAGEFIEEDVIVIEVFRDDREEYTSSGTAVFKDIPTVVLVNGGSASASEIVAGALQDYQQATVVGEQTFGKGSVQDFEEFSDGSSLKLTVAKWQTPLGRTIGENGILPDIKVELTEENYNNNSDPQLDKALELLK